MPPFIHISFPENGSVLIPAMYVEPLIGSSLYLYTLNMSSNSSVEALTKSSNNSVNGLLPVKVSHLF